MMTLVTSVNSSNPKDSDSQPATFSSKLPTHIESQLEKQNRSSRTTPPKCRKHQEAKPQAQNFSKRKPRVRIPFSKPPLDYDCRCTLLTISQNMVKVRRMHPAIQRVVSQAKHQWRQTQVARIRELPRERISPESWALKGSQWEVYRRT